MPRAARHGGAAVETTQAGADPEAGAARGEGAAAAVAVVVQKAATQLQAAIAMCGGGWPAAFGARLLGSLQQCLTPAGRAVGRLDAGQHQGCPIVNLRDPSQLDSQPCIVTTPTISKAVSKDSGCYYQKLAASDSSAQKGYLYVKVAPGYHEVAHRLVLWTFDGPPQDPLHQVIHLCGRNNCLNPCHMVWVSGRWHGISPLA
ncbi:hypothetical protein HaLaN_10352 [Haematococcus lacustris]|uniref:Zinc-binding loop region of homing endonuclease domain-containing protein n=1 Tax=Haematococcus lacustris TaxID=44745 RepID=A0A699YXJ5_HAELA|nr:hypothetical protein HaLaN_10352 [Haematococcus lacustris]